jgi:hypothetical protein
LPSDDVPDWINQIEFSNRATTDAGSATADVDIPDRKFKMTMSFRSNTDKSLPASHTARVIFTLPSDFDNGGIAEMPGILMKSDEQSHATALAGLAVKVREGFFLVGLSNVDADRQHNIQLLNERSWFPTPDRLTGRHRNKFGARFAFEDANCRGLHLALRPDEKRQLARTLVRERFFLADQHPVAVAADFERTCLVRS